MTDPLTEMLASLKEKLRAATPAPWTASEDVPGAIEVFNARWKRPMNLFGLDVDGMAICSHKPDAAYIAALDPDLVAALIGCAEALERIQKMDRRAADWDRQHNVLAYADGPCGQLACHALAQLRKLAEGRTR